jgi:ribosomal protein S18 acetylase RimI-like enzyme
MERSKTKMHKINFTIKQITKKNYHMFADMVDWRMNGVELTKEEKEANKKKTFTEEYKELEHPGFYSYAALYDGRFIGWISLMYTPKIGGARWKKGVIYVDELWTAPEFRGRGVATKLFQKAYDCQKETGAVEVRLYVGTDNVMAQELYKKCGMKAMWNALYMTSKEDD